MTSSWPLIRTTLEGRPFRQHGGAPFEGRFVRILYEAAQAMQFGSKTARTEDRRRDSDKPHLMAATLRALAFALIVAVVVLLVWLLASRCKRSMRRLQIGQLLISLSCVERKLAQNSGALSPTQEPHVPGGGPALNLFPFPVRGLKVEQALLLI